MTIETLLSPIELLAREEGRQEGRQEGLDQARRLDVLDALEARFGSCADPVAERVRSLLGEPALRRALRLAVTARTLQDFLGSL
jgi:predicted transposase YdaD